MGAARGLRLRRGDSDFEGGKDSKGKAGLLIKACITGVAGYVRLEQRLGAGTAWEMHNNKGALIISTRVSFTVVESKDFIYNCLNKHRKCPYSSLL